MSFARPTSGESEVSCETNVPQDAPPQAAGKCCEDGGGGPRTQRSISIPVVATSALSDISERSNEPEQAKRSLEIPEESSPDAAAYQETRVNCSSSNNNNDESADDEQVRQSMSGFQSNNQVNQKETTDANESECTAQGGGGGGGGETVAHSNARKRYRHFVRR